MAGILDRLTDLSERFAVLVEDNGRVRDRLRRIEEWIDPEGEEDSELPPRVRHVVGLQPEVAIPPTPSADRYGIRTPILAPAPERGRNREVHTTHNSHGNIKIDKFSGADLKPGDTISWLKKLELQFLDRHIDAERTKLSKSLLSLEGGAWHWATNAGDFESFQDFKNKLCERYEATDLEASAKLAISKLRYNNDPNALYDEYIHLVDLVTPIRENPEWVRENYIAKLPEVLQNILRKEHADKPLRALVKVIEDQQQAWLQERNAIVKILNPRSTPSTSSRATPSYTYKFGNDTRGSSFSKTNQSTPVPKPPAPTQPKATSNGERVPDQLFKDRVSKGLCGKCGEPGHIARRCQNKVKTTSSSSSGNSTPARTSSN